MRPEDFSGLAPGATDLSGPVYLSSDLEPLEDEDGIVTAEPDDPISPFELDVDEEEIHVPPAIARRLAESPHPAIVLEPKGRQTRRPAPDDADLRALTMETPPLKSSRAIADLERRGKPTQILKEKIAAGYRSPWEGKPRDGFTATQADRAVNVLSKEPAGKTAAGKLPGHTEQAHR